MTEKVVLLLKSLYRVLFSADKTNNYLTFCKNNRDVISSQLPTTTTDTTRQEVKLQESA